MLKVALDVPAISVMYGKTAAALLDAAMLTLMPPLGAGPVRDKYPYAEAPPTTLIGSIVNPCKVGGLILSVALAEAVAVLPVITSLAMDETGFVVIWNPAEMDPAATVTVPGTTPLTFADFSETTTPPAAALPERVTNPLTEVPPVTVLGLTEIEDTTGALIRSFADLELLWNDALMSA
jgi:hypothetical protein